MTGVTLAVVLGVSTRRDDAGRGKIGHRAARMLRGAGAVLIIPLLSGCLVTTKTAEGRALHAAPRLVARAHSLGVSLSVSSRLVRRGSLTTLPGPDPGFHLEGVLDLDSGRAEYTTAGKPVVVFDGERAYGLRPRAAANDARPWVQVTVDEDLQDLLLDPSAVPPSLAALALRPSVLVDSLAGALTGSIKTRGTEIIDGATTTKYTARFDLIQALAESKRVRYSQQDQDDLAHFFDILGIKTDALNDGAVWLDSDGALRRLALGVRVSPAPESLIVVSFDLRLTPRTNTARIDVPDANTVTHVPSLFQYLQPLRSASA